MSQTPCAVSNGIRHLFLESELHKKQEYTALACCWWQDISIIVLSILLIFYKSECPLQRVSKDRQVPHKLLIKNRRLLPGGWECRAVQFTEVTEANSAPKDRVGGFMLPSTAQRLLAAASLCSSGHGHVPKGILREGWAAQLQGRAPAQVHFSASGKAILFPFPHKRGKINWTNIYIFFSCL